MISQHKTIRTLLLVCLLSSALVPAIRAEQPPWQLPPNAAFLDDLPQPPASGTPAAKADLDYVIALQSQPTKQELAHAEKSVSFSVFTFAEVRGNSFQPASYPKTAAFFKRLEGVANTRKNWLKDVIHRERPYKAYPGQVKALVTVEDGYSCPSGHSLRSWLDALVMGDLDPARRSDYLACAVRVNTDRVLGGMHYPSDTVAGRILAEAIYTALMADDSFKRELEQLRKDEYAK